MWVRWPAGGATGRGRRVLGWRRARPGGSCPPAAGGGAAGGVAWASSNGSSEPLSSADAGLVQARPAAATRENKAVAGTAKIRGRKDIEYLTEMHRLPR